MDWQSMVTFSVVFWATYHLLNAVRDWRRDTELYRLLREVRSGSKVDAKFPPPANGDTVKRVK